MPEVSVGTLVIAIQAVDDLIQELRLHPEETSPEEDLFFEDCVSAAEELKEAYIEATRLVINHPPYSKLINRR